MPPRLSLKVRSEIILLCANHSSRQIAYIIHQKYPEVPKPSSSTIIRLLKKFKASGETRDLPRTGRSKSATNENHSLDVLALISVNPLIGIKRASDEAGISPASVHRILKKEKYHPYKIKVLHTLKEGDPQRRIQFCNWMSGKIAQDPEFIENVMFTDECLFFLDGRMHTSNVRHWSPVNPHVFLEGHDQSAPRVMVWAGIWRDQVVGPFFFEGTVTGQTYLELLQNELTDFLDGQPLAHLQKMWFQQDGAAPHFAIQVRRHLDRQFPNQWIGRSGAVEWPARSPDLSPLDFHLWGTSKTNVFGTIPATLEEVKDRLVNFCRNIPAYTFFNIRKNFRKRIEKCLLNDGRHIEHIIN